MNELAVLDRAPAGDLTMYEGDLDVTARFLAAEKADATRRAYASDWRIFVAYYGPRGLMPLPACQDTVMAFLATEATGGAKASTLGRRIAAIRYAHKCAGLEPSTNTPGRRSKQPLENVHRQGRTLIRGSLIGRDFTSSGTEGSIQLHRAAKRMADGKSPRGADRRPWKSRSEGTTFTLSAVPNPALLHTLRYSKSEVRP